MARIKVRHEGSVSILLTDAGIIAFNQDEDTILMGPAEADNVFKALQEMLREKWD